VFVAAIQRSPPVDQRPVVLNFTRSGARSVLHQLEEVGPVIGSPPRVDVDTRISAHS